MARKKKYVRKTADVMIDGQMRRCRILEREMPSLFGEKCIAVSYEGKVLTVAVPEKTKQQ